MRETLDSAKSRMLWSIQLLAGVFPISYGLMEQDIWYATQIFLLFRRQLIIFHQVPQHAPDQLGEHIFNILSPISFSRL
jgi:hypothetical protein